MTNYEKAKQRMFVCKVCKKTPPDIQYNFSQSGEICESCLEIFEFIIVLLFALVAGMALIYLLLTLLF